MSGDSIYTERILSRRMFRLLFILPASDQSHQLECYCLPFNIDDAPAYEALSYVWGKSISPSQITCNGKSVTVGLELSNALTKLRLPEVTRIIWADALCINQRDKTEKSHQVPLMGSIYSLAKRVIIWLGKGDTKQIVWAFTYSILIANACLQYDEERGLSPGHDERYEAMSLPEEILSPSAWESLKELYERPWFSRVWCVQEIRLAKDALVLWGDFEIPWLLLSLAAACLFDKLNSDEAKYSEIPSAVSHPDILRDKNRYPLLGALQSFREFESTDPRDKVYGLLNLVDNQSEREALSVSYYKSVGEVYADTVLVTIRLHSSLSALAHITHPEDYDPEYKKDQPLQYRSWAPRWDDWAVADVMGYPEAGCRWKPYGDNKAAMIADHDSRHGELCLGGVLYNRVTKVGEVLDYYNLKDPVLDDETVIRPDDDSTDLETDSQSDNPNPLLEIFDIAFDESSSEGAHTAWARTLTAGQWDLDQKYIENLDLTTQELYYHAYYRFMRRLKELQLTGMEGNFAHNEDSAKFESTVYNVCKQRRIFWVENKSFGLGPHCMQPEDIVVVLYGGNTPYILRPRGDKFLFMGHAYIDNIMHGEIFNGLVEYEKRTFCLI